MIDFFLQSKLLLRKVSFQLDEVPQFLSVPVVKQFLEKVITKLSIIGEHTGRSAGTEKRFQLCSKGSLADPGLWVLLDFQNGFGNPRCDHQQLHPALLPLCTS